MSVILKELREKRNALLPTITQLREKANSEAGFTAEERANWAKVNADYDRLSEQIDVNEREAKLEAESREIPGDRRTGRDDLDRRNNPGQLNYREVDLAVAGFMRASRGITPPDEERAAAEAMGITLGASECRIQIAPVGLRSRRAQTAYGAPYERALSGNLQTAGGAFVESGFLQALEVNMVAFGGMSNAADVLVTDDNRKMPWPIVDDTTNEGERLNEGESAGDADPNTGRFELDAFEYSSKFVKIPNPLFRATGFNLGGMAGGMIGERLARKGNRDWSKGNGVNGPRGIYLDAGLGRTTDAPTKFTYDDFILLEHSIDPAYRVGDDVGYMLHDSILAQLRLLKHGNGTYLWTSGVQAGQPDRLNGKKFWINQQFDDALTASLKPVFFGKWSYYKIRQVGALVLRKAEERFIEKNQTAYIAFMEWDGGMLNPGTTPIKYMQMRA